MTAFPWEKLRPGQGFFVPAIDTEVVVRAGLRAAVGKPVNAKYTVGVKDGQLGVWFYLGRPRTVEQHRFVERE